jgi:hypothetical protein
MIRNRRLRWFGFALAGAAAWAIAPGLASADDPRDHRRHDVRGDDRDHDRGDRDRYDDHRDRARKRHDDRDRVDRNRSKRDRQRFERDRREGERIARKGPWQRYSRHDHRSHDSRGERYRNERHRYENHRHRYESDRYGADRHRFRRYTRRNDRYPYWCADHRHGFHDRRHFDDHLVRLHFLPHWRLPALVAHLGFGWTYGH